MDELTRHTITAVAGACAGAALALFGVSDGWVKVTADRKTSDDVAFLSERLGKAIARSDLTDTKVGQLDEQMGLVEKALTSMEGAGLVAINWWCSEFRCRRTKAACQVQIGAATVYATEHGDSKLATLAEKAECHGAAIAYCDDAECYFTRGICEQYDAKEMKCRGVL